MVTAALQPHSPHGSQSSSKKVCVCVCERENRQKSPRGCQPMLVLGAHAAVLHLSLCVPLLAPHPSSFSIHKPWLYPHHHHHHHPHLITKIFISLSDILLLFSFVCVCLCGTVHRLSMFVLKNCSIVIWPSNNKQHSCNCIKY